MISEFEKEYNRAREKMLHIINISGMLDLALKTTNIDDIEATAVALSMEVDNLSLIARRLPHFTGRTTTQEVVERQITDVMNIRVGFTAEGWLAIKMPELLPMKKDSSRRSEFVTDSVRITLREFKKKHESIMFKECVIITCNIYDKSRSKNVWRDYDNIEHKRVVDIVSSFFLIDDSPIFCDRLYSSFYGEEDATLIYLVPYTELIDWFGYSSSNELPDILK